MGYYTNYSVEITPDSEEIRAHIEDDGWNDVGSDTQQNRRCSAVFRDNRDNSTARYIDGKVFSDDGGETWFTRGGEIGSSVPVWFPYSVPAYPEYIILSDEKEAD